MAIKTIVGVTGIIKFCDLETPVTHPDYPEGKRRYRIEMQTPQSNDIELKPLKAAIAHVGKRTWVGSEATKRMRAVQRTIDEGDGTSSGQIGLLNGDEYKPDYNLGTFVIRASARANEQPIFRNADEEIVDEAPKPGDLVKVSIEVWAMKQHSRINFTMKGIQMVKPGFAPVTGGQPVTNELLDETLDAPEPEVLSLFDGLGGTDPQIEAGDEEEVEEEIEEAPAPKPKPKAKRKKAAKKKAAKPKPTPVVEPDDVLEPGDDDEDDEPLAADSGGGGLFDDL